VSKDCPENVSMNLHERKCDEVKYNLWSHCILLDYAFFSLRTLFSFFAFIMKHMYCNVVLASVYKNS